MTTLQRHTLLNQVYSELQKLREVEGMVSIEDGIAHLPDGETVNLNDTIHKIVQATGGG